jgi:hypothetical protein
VSMTSEDWHRMARMHRAGAVAYTNSPYYDTRRHSAALHAQADECEAIAAEIDAMAKRDANPPISCAECKQMKPGPGVYFRGVTGGKRLCQECAEALA